MRKLVLWATRGLAVVALVVLAGGPATAKDVTFTVSEGTNFAVAASPDGTALALDLQGRIWTLPAAGGKAVPITPVMVEARYPVWSPDGQSIAFQYYTDEAWHIAVARRDGSDLRQLTFGLIDDREPSWRPDGKAIVFSTDREHSLDLWQVPLDGGAAAPITKGPADDFYPAVSPNGLSTAYVQTTRGATSLIVETQGKKTTLLTGRLSMSRPFWSPDNTRLALVVYNLDRGDARIDVLDAATGKVLASRDAGEDIFPTGASWIDAKRIVYAADGGIRVWQPGGRRVTKTPFTAEFTVMERPTYTKREIDFTSTSEKPVLGILRPMTSPDGRQIAFTALGDLWLLNVGDPKPVQLTKDAYLDLDPTWSRDGKTLAFVSDKRGTGTMDLYLRDMASGAERRLTETEEDLLQPAFSPDGKSIAVFMRDADDWHDANLYLVDIASGAMKKAYDALFLPSVPSWSADGSKISVLSLQVYSDRFRKGDNAFFTIDLASGKGRFTTPDANRSVSSRSQFGPIWSPDGARMAYIHEGLLWVAAVDAEANFLEPPVQLTRQYVAYPSWSGDSKSLTYLAGRKLQRVYIDDGRTEAIPLDLAWRRPANTQTLVVQAGRVFTGVSDKYLRDVDVVVEDNIIKQIVPRRAAWPGARIIDARSKTLVPGLFQTHIHQFASDGAKIDKIWMSFGITSVREPGAEPYEALERREAWNSGQRIGPRQFYANLLEGNRLFYWMNTGVVANAQLEMELQRAVDLDFDFIKTYETMDHEVMKRIVEFAHAHGLPVASHEMYPAAVFGVDAIEHLGTRDRMEFSDRVSIKRRIYDDVVQILARSGMYISPTAAGRAPQATYMTEMDANPGILDLPQVKSFAPRYARAHASMMTYLRGLYGDRGAAREKDELASLARMKKAGVTFGAGTDGGQLQDGYSVILEMIHFAKAFGNYEALRTGTIEAARITGVEKYLGSIEPGKIADMVVVDGDPLKSIADLYKVDTVIKDGRAYPLQALLGRYDGARPRLSSSPE
jgi:Tol biopolymer transport system component/imidazolonepropionase-like amidohydrolase